MNSQAQMASAEELRNAYHDGTRHTTTGRFTAYQQMVYISMRQNRAAQQVSAVMLTVSTITTSTRTTAICNPHHSTTIPPVAADRAT